MTTPEKPGTPDQPTITPPDGKVEVLPPEAKDLEKVQALLAAVIGPLVDGHRLSEEQNTARLRAQLRAQTTHLLIGAIVILVCIAIAAFFAWLGLADKRYEFAERVVVLIIGVGIGFVSGRLTR